MGQRKDKQYISIPSSVKSINFAQRYLCDEMILTHDEIILLVDEWLNTAPNIRKRIKLINIELKEGTQYIAYVKRLKQERICLVINY